MEKKRRVSYLYRTAQLPTLATFLSWGIKKELVVQDLPRRKDSIFLMIDKLPIKNVHSFL